VLAVDTRLQKNTFYCHAVPFPIWWLRCPRVWSTRLTASVVATTSIILSSNKIQKGDILVPAYPVPPGKMAVKMERDVAACNVQLSGN